MEIELWENNQGVSPVGKFIESRELKARTKIMWVIDLLEEKGIKLLHTGYMKKLHGYNIYELITRYGGVFYRIFFVIVGETAWLLHAFEKKTPYTPKKEIDISLNRIKLLETSLSISLQ